MKCAQKIIFLTKKIVQDRLFSSRYGHIIWNPTAFFIIFCFFALIRYYYPVFTSLYNNMLSQL